MDTKFNKEDCKQNSKLGPKSEEVVPIVQQSDSPHFQQRTRRSIGRLTSKGTGSGSNKIPRPRQLFSVVSQKDDTGRRRNAQNCYRFYGRHRSYSSPGNCSEPCQIHKRALSTPTRQVALVEPSAHYSTSFEKDVSVGLSTVEGCKLSNAKPTQNFNLDEIKSHHKSRLDEDEQKLCTYCWVPFGIGTITVGEAGGKYDLDTRSWIASGISDHHTILDVPPNAIDPGSTVEIRYAIIPDGPFNFPEGYRLGSMVVYLVAIGAKLKKPMILCLPHWLSCVSSGSERVKCCRASHSLQSNKATTFSFLHENDYNITETSNLIQVDGVNCLFATAYEEGVQQMYQYQVFEKEDKKQKYVCIYITYSTFSWQEIVNKYCAKPNWKQKRVPFVPRFAITDDFLNAEHEVSPDSARKHWIIAVDGAKSIPKESFNFNKMGNVTSLEDDVKNSRYPPAFSFKVFHNGSRKDQLKKCHVSFKLSPTEPAVEISVDAGCKIAAKARPKSERDPSVRRTAVLDIENMEPTTPVVDNGAGRDKESRVLLTKRQTPSRVLKENTPKRSGSHASTSHNTPQNDGKGLDESSFCSSDNKRTKQNDQDIDGMTPSDVGLLRVAKKIGSCDELAVELGIPLSHITSIPDGSLKGSLTLAYWRDGRGTSSFHTTWGFLLEKVEDLSGRNVAEELRETLSKDPACVLK